MRPRSSRSESRRIEARRERSEYRADLWQKTVRWMRPRVLAIWVGFYVAVLLILLSGHESMPWRLGERVDQDIAARVPFELEDQIALASERRAAKDAAPNVYAFDPKPIDRIVSGITALLQAARNAPNSEPLTKELAAQGWTLDASGIAAIEQFARGEKRPEAIDRLAAALRHQLELRYVADQPSDPRRQPGPPTSILRRPDQPDVRILADQLLQVSNPQEIEKAARQVAAELFPSAVQPAASELIRQGVLSRAATKDGKPAPWWVYDAAATTIEMQHAEAAVKPVRVPIRPGDLLVPAGTVLSNVELMRLRQEHAKYLEAQQEVPALRHQTQRMKLGMAGIVLLVTVGLATYTIAYQNRVFQLAQTAGLACLMLVVVLLGRLTERAQYPWDLPVEFSVAYVVLAASLMAIAYDQRVALGSAGGLSVLVTLACRGDLGLYLTMAVAAAFTIFALKEVRTRSKIIAVGMLAGLVAGVASISSGFIAGQDLKYVLVHAASAVAACLAAGFFMQGILPNFERLFGVATSMTLLEWSDANRPLLRRLAQEAPGTYSHSLVLSQMAEEAAEAIGARGLLCRVGALYHDVGKIQKPEYFVENQEARMNLHDRLSPTMSLLIIVGHVKDGVEMARAYSVPSILHQFIAEHHGTTVVKYFHYQASEAAKRKGRHPGEAAESEFRYPGPKPRSKETAILMLCDGCEGAVRSLAQPIPGRIESTVHQVIMDRLNDGQFDECDITLRELKLIEKSLVKSLGAVHHARIKYPKAVEPEPAADESARPREAPGPGQASGYPPEVARQA